MPPGTDIAYWEWKPAGPTSFPSAQKLT